MKGIQYNPFHKKQLLLLPLHPPQARFPFGIGNGVNGISDKSAHVTKCDTLKDIKAHYKIYHIS